MASIDSSTFKITDYDKNAQIMDITLQPSNATVNAGDVVTFSVNAAYPGVDPGDAIKYWWTTCEEFNGDYYYSNIESDSNISGINTKTLQITTSKTKDYSNTYCCFVGNSKRYKISNMAKLVINNV